MRARVLLLLACILPCAARAEWQEASSKHFILYSNDKPERLKAFTIKLERFDKALRVERHMADDPISPEARITVFVVDDVEDVQKLAHGQSNVAGFYQPRSHAIAIVPRASGRGENDLHAQQILLHEYTHHFMLSNWTNAAFPAWFVEGFAEFNATAIFGSDDSVTLGAWPQYRAFGLFHAELLPINRLLDVNPGRLTDEQTDVLYGRGWLLTHYLSFDPSRAGQLDGYIAAINAGKPMADAKKQLKDVEKLDSVLDAYADRPRLMARKLTGKVLAVEDPVVRALRPAEAAVMPARIRSAAGVNPRSAETVAILARKLATPYPNDPAAQNELAEAEYDAGDYGAAEAAADRALAAEPKSLHALIYKGMARGAAAAKAKKTDIATWDGVRRWYIAANKIDTEDPVPLTLFYNSFAAAGQAPTRNAEQGLLYAYALAPYDLSLRFKAGGIFLQRGDAMEARRAIAPLAYSAHGGGENAKRVLAALDEKGPTAALIEMNSKTAAEPSKGDGKIKPGDKTAQ